MHSSIVAGRDLTEEGASHRNPEWLERHFLRPNSVSPNSAMPNFNFTKKQARALTFYMLPLTNEQMGAYYASVLLIPSPAYGRVWQGSIMPAYDLDSNQRKAIIGFLSVATPEDAHSILSERPKVLAADQAARCHRSCTLRKTIPRARSPLPSATARCHPPKTP